MNAQLADERRQQDLAAGVDLLLTSVPGVMRVSG